MSRRQLSVGHVSEARAGYCDEHVLRGQNERTHSPVSRPGSLLRFHFDVSDRQCLLRTWDLLTAADYQIEDVTDRARELLARSRSIGSSIAPRGPNWILRQTDSERRYPSRADQVESGDARQIGINPLTTEDAIWYAGPDLAASVLLSGKVPQIEERVCDRTEARKVGQRPARRGLRPVKLLDAIPIDPRRENFFTG